MNNEINYDKDVSIDPDSLDTEWLAQPQLMIKYSRISSAARRSYEAAKMDLDIIKAELDQQIRMDPAKFEIPKLTEGAIQSAILTSKKYKGGMDALHEAAYEMNMASAAVQAIDAKKGALENLVRLHGMQYFAGPKVPRDLSKEWQQRKIQEDSDRKVIIKRKK